MKPDLMSGRADIPRFDLQEQQYAILVAYQVHLAGIVLLCRKGPIAHLNGKAALPKTLGQRELYSLGFSLHIGPTRIHSAKIIDGCR